MCSRFSHAFADSAYADLRALCGGGTVRLNPAERTPNTLLQMVALLSEPLELLPVSLVFSAFLGHLPCHPLEFFLHLSVRLAELLPLVQKLLLLLLCLR